MPETLEALERQRTKLYEQLQTLGDFRPGTILVNFRKCGKTTALACVKVTRARTPNTCGIPRRGTNPGAEFTYGFAVGRVGDA